MARFVDDIFRTEAAATPVSEIIQPQSVQDIVEVMVAQKKSNKGRITVVGGGHSTLCTREGGIVIDMRKSLCFREVKVARTFKDGKEQVMVHMGGGANLQDVSNALKGSGWSVPIGTFQSVGMGLVLQGGIGYLTRLCGLTIDSIVGADLVDATGNVVHADEELLWAIRGAGNQIGAVVTNVQLRAVPWEIMCLDRIVMQVNASQAKKHLVMLWSTSFKLPLSDSLGFLIQRNDKDSYTLMLVFSSMNNSTNDNFLPQLLGIDKGAICWRDRQPQLSYNESAGLFDLPPEYCRINKLFADEPPSSAIHAAFVGGEHFESRMEQLAHELVKVLEEAPNHTDQVARIDFQHTGGEVLKHVSPTETAFWNRNQEYSCVIFNHYPTGNVDAERFAYEWVDSVETVLSGAGAKVGCYSVDVMRPGEGRFQKDAKTLLIEEAYGENWERIRKIREKLDPEGILRPHDM